MENTLIDQVISDINGPKVIGFIHIPEPYVQKCVSCNCTIGKYDKSFMGSNVCRPCEEEMMYPTY